MVGRAPAHVASRAVGGGLSGFPGCRSDDGIRGLYSGDAGYVSPSRLLPLEYVLEEDEVVPPTARFPGFSCWCGRRVFWYIQFCSTRNNDERLIFSQLMLNLQSVTSITCFYLK